jgi:hypothetical protein
MFLPVLFHFPYGLIFIMRHQPCFGLILLEALRGVDKVMLNWLYLFKGVKNGRNF